MKSFILEIWKSITDFNFYREIPSRPLSVVFRYLSGLLGMYIVLITLLVAPGITMGINSVADWMIKNVPSATISQGEVVFHGITEPYRRAEEKQFLFLIDTKTPDVSFDPEYANCVIVKKDRVLIKSGQYIKEYAFPKNKTVTLSEETISGWKNIVMALAILFIFLLNIVSVVFSKGLQSIMVTLVVFLYMKVKNVPCDFSSLWKISVYALTAPLVLSLFIFILGIHIPFFWIVYIAFYLVFCLGAVHQLMRPQPTETP